MTPPLLTTSRLSFPGNTLKHALESNQNSSVGVDADEEKLSLVISQLSGKDVNEVIAEGKEKLASVPTGGAAAAGGAAAGGAVAEEAKEEAKASSSEESGDDDMGFGLFD